MHGGGKVISAQAVPLCLLLIAQAIVIGMYWRMAEKHQKETDTRCRILAVWFCKQSDRDWGRNSSGTREEMGKLEIQHKAESYPDGVFNKFIRHIWKTVMNIQMGSGSAPLGRKPVWHLLCIAVRITLIFPCEEDHRTYSDHWVMNRHSNQAGRGLCFYEEELVTECFTAEMEGVASACQQTQQLRSRQTCSSRTPVLWLWLTPQVPHHSIHPPLLPELPQMVSSSQDVSVYRGRPHFL